MSRFVGGSAFSMVRDIAGGYFTATIRTFQRMSVADRNQFGQELDKQLRDLRGQQPPTGDTVATQAHHRKIQRLRTTQVLLRNQMVRPGGR